VIPAPPDGYTTVHEVYCEVHRRAPAYWDWREGKAWPSFFPKSERFSEAVVGMAMRSMSVSGVTFDPYGHDLYLKDVNQAAWRLTQTIVGNVGELIVVKAGVESRMNPSAMCDMAEFPLTPWGDMARGRVNWSDDAFSKLIPSDFGQRETWQSWIEGLDGGLIFLPADKTKKMIAQAKQGGQKQGGQKLRATQILAKEFEPLTDEELDALGPVKAKRYLKSRGKNVSESKAKRALTCERERRKNLTTQS
jgi:hypothetical protein